MKWRRTGSETLGSARRGLGMAFRSGGVGGSSAAALFSNGTGQTRRLTTRRNGVGDGRNSGVSDDDPGAVRGGRMTDMERGESFRGRRRDTRSEDVIFTDRRIRVRVGRRRGALLLPRRPKVIRLSSSAISRDAIGAPGDRPGIRGGPKRASTPTSPAIARVQARGYRERQANQLSCGRSLGRLHAGVGAHAARRGLLDRRRRRRSARRGRDRDDRLQSQSQVAWLGVVHARFAEQRVEWLEEVSRGTGEVVRYFKPGIVRDE